LKNVSGTFYTANLWMADREISLSAGDQTKTLNSITFYATTGSSGNNQLALFAVSGCVSSPTAALVCPTNNQAFNGGDTLFATAVVSHATGDYTVHVYTNSGSGAFAEVGTGSSASPYALNLGCLAGGTYHIYATVSDSLATTATPTNTFTVAGQQTLGLSGWNKDLIIGKTETAPGYTSNMGGWNFYERGLSGGTLGLPADSDGTNRTLTSSYNSRVQFQFAPYTTNNAAFISGSNTVTLTLDRPAKFYSLQFLATTRTSGSLVGWYVRLNFADGSNTASSIWSDSDWTSSGPADRCLTSYGLKSTSGSFYSGFLWMADREITLSPADQSKTLTSITVCTTTTGDQQLALFAVSGYALGSAANGIHAVDVTSAGGGPGLGATYSVGWDFTVSQTITITSLGQFDPDSNPKTNSVAIYRRGGSKLVEASVAADSSTEPSGIYTARYAAICNLVLTNGNYVIVSTQNGDNFIAPNGNPAAAFGPAIAWNKGVAMDSGSAAGPLPATAPTTWPIENLNASRYFGPTFKYQLGDLTPMGIVVIIR
jgi:hypothetical protein